MRVVHCVESFPPEPTGGIQSLIRDLAPLLREQDVTSIVAASTSDGSPRDYELDGLPVHRYPVAPPARLRPTGSPDLVSIEHFRTWLARQDADVLALHRWNRSAGRWHLAVARELGLRTVVHVHLPEPLCPRGTLMLHGATQCDGVIDVARCSGCLGGTPPPTRLTLRLGTAIDHLGLGAALRARTRDVPDVLRRASAATWAPGLARQRRRWFDTFADLADLVVVPLPSIETAFLANGFPPERLVRCEYGAEHPGPDYRWSPSEDGVTRIGFFGRTHVDKGLPVLVEAFRRTPADVHLELVVRTTVTDADLDRRLRAMIDDDPRIRVLPPFGRDEQVEAYGSLDALAIPSQWFELGPLVLHEARAHGLPVVGSRLGGIAEVVRDDQDGLLVQHDDVAAWSRALQRLATEPGLLRRLSSGIPVGPTPLDEARTWAECYAGTARTVAQD